MNKFKWYYIFSLMSALNSCIERNNKIGYDTYESTTDFAAETFSDYCYGDSVASKDIFVENSKPVSLPSSNFQKVYTDGKISINYPSSWEIVKQNTKATTNTTIAVHIMEMNTTDYDFCPNINIIFSKRKWTEPTSQLAIISYNQAKEASFTDSLIGIYDCEISNCKGSVIEYIALVDDFNLHFYQYIVKKKDNTTIIITMTLDQDNLNRQIITAQKIIDSIIIF